MVKAKKVVDNSDGVAYTKAQFVEFYGEKKANKIFEAADKRAADPEPKANAKAKGGKAKKVVDKTDGVAYTKDQFVEFYGEKKANKIFEAAEKSAGAPEPKAKAKKGADGGATAKKKASPKKKEASPKKERPPRQLATEGEIPITRVARVYRATVKDEEGALKLDALVNDVYTKLRENRNDKSKGFVKLVRMVCKSEWAFEVSIVWRSFDDFTAYKESEFRKEVSGEFETKIKNVISGDFYTGVRVYDEL